MANLSWIVSPKEFKICYYFIVNFKLSFPFLNLGNKLICCESAVKDFRVIVDTLGGEGEKLRAKILLDETIDQVVPDGMSDRLKNLDLSGKIKERSRAIFGTGDLLQVFESLIVGEFYGTSGEPFMAEV